MINNILDLVKEAIKSVVDGNINVPVEKKEEVIDIAGATLGKGLEDNISSLSGLLSGENSSTIDGLKNTVVDALADKVGLSKDVAGQIASSLIPAVLGVLSDAMGGRKPLSLDSLAEVVTGFSSNNNKKGSLLDTITKLFKK